MTREESLVNRLNGEVHLLYCASKQMPYVTIMDKAFLKKCIDQEVDHWAGTKNTSFPHKIWFRHFQAESNAVFQYWGQSDSRIQRRQMQCYSYALRQP